MQESDRCNSFKSSSAVGSTLVYRIQSGPRFLVPLIVPLYDTFTYFQTCHPLRNVMAIIELYIYISGKRGERKISYRGETSFFQHTISFLRENIINIRGTTISPVPKPLPNVYKTNYRRRQDARLLRWHR